MQKYLTASLILLLAACSDTAVNQDESSELEQPTAALAQTADSKKMQAYCDEQVSLRQADLKTLESLKPPFNVVTVLEPLNQFEIVLSDGFSHVNLYGSVHPDEATREAADNCSQRLSKINTNYSLSRPVFDALVSVDVKKQDAETQRYHKMMIQQFKLSGVDKDDETRGKVKTINEEITKVGQDFDKNIRDDVRFLTLNSASQLEGLPTDYIASHTANDKGEILVSTKYPDLYPFLTYAKDDDLRKQLYILGRSRGYPENKPILENLVKLRHQLATLLGFSSWAEYVTADKMSGDPKVVQTFMNEVASLAGPSKDTDRNILLKQLQKTDPAATLVQAWQKSYLQEQLKQDEYKLDTKEVREYFSYSKVRDGIFTLISDLFSVTIRPWATDTWHESVQGYEMLDNGKVIGRFYLDMHPREGKYQHAAQFPIQKGVTGLQVPIAALICNFPGGSEGSELMEHGQVETFLHEFGHLIHTLFSGEHKWNGISGISTEWDFVEAPSQMLEEWVWDKKTLQSFATNEKGESIPDNLVEKMKKVRDFGLGMNTMQQLYYASLSLNLYNQNPENLDLEGLTQRMQATYSPYPHVEGTHFYTSFGHLNGYSAIYYTYQWSLAIAMDMFTRFEKEGMTNKKVAMEYRQKVLSQGGSKPAAQLIEDFLGRPYSFKAYADKLNKKG